MKRVGFAAVLFVAYLLVFAAGSFMQPLKVVRVLRVGAGGLAARLFVWDGVLLMLGMYGLTLLLLVAGRRLRGGWPWATGALLLSLVCGLLLRLGFVTRGV